MEEGSAGYPSRHHLPPFVFILPEQTIFQVSSAQMLLFWRQLFLSFRRNMFPCVITHPVAHNIQPEQTFLEDLRVGPW